MSSQKSITLGPSYKRGETSLGIIVLILGIALVFISQNTSFQDYGVRFGFILIAFATTIIIWNLYALISNSNVFGLLIFIKKENIIAIFKDKNRGKEVITNSILEWAQNPKEDTIKIKGVTLNLVFGNTGILKECLDENKIVNPDTKKLQILLLNPFSMNALTRSIQESRPFDKEDKPVSAICKHTLNHHKKCVLYNDFEIVAENIRNLMINADKYKIKVECKIYSTTSPSFLLINSQRAISENLILGKKKNEPEGKLYGILPHLIYGKGEIKESLDTHFDYIWDYDSLPLEDFNEKTEEKYYEINRLFLLYPLQKDIWDFQYAKIGARKLKSVYNMLFQGLKEYYPDFSPKRILDLGCGDGGGGSMDILKEYPNIKIDFIDISKVAITLFQTNIKNEGRENPYVVLKTNDMLTFLNLCESLQYSLVYANFSIIYMTKIKAIEIYRLIFNSLHSGGIFTLSLWTTDYFKMPISTTHGEEGHRPPHEFARVPMTEDLRLVCGGSEREGEIRRFYRGMEELMEEFVDADENKTMDFENIIYKYYENNAILRVWLKKK